MTDAADGTDGFAHDTNPDDPVAGAALTSEGDVDAERPQERLRPAQLAGELAGAFGPAGVAIETTLAAATGAHPQQVGGGPAPGAALGHDLANAGCHRVGVDDVVDRGAASA